jgi:uncharacterized membrane protein
MADGKQSRLAYIDWMRGFACLVMFQTHCYDSWLAEPARHTKFFWWSQLGGTLPAPLFLFLAGISFSLITDKMRERGASAGVISRTTILRGAEILGLGLLFRVQEWMLGGGWAPWTDLFRVDILNTIGVSMMLMGVVCWIAGSVFVSRRNADGTGVRIWNIFLAAAAGMTISLISPMIWTTWRPRFLPWPLESYIDGVHIFDKPQAWLFPIFPWSAIAFAGLVAGFILVGKWARAHVAETIGLLTVGGAALGGFAWWLDRLPVTLYANYDFWHTSPNFLLIRVGIVCVILGGAYVWCRWGAGQKGFSPMIEMGKSSLLVYWVHIELVYGGLSIMAKRSQTIGTATFGFAVIFVSMVLLATIRNGTKGRGKEIRAWMENKMRTTRGSPAGSPEATRFQRCEQRI